jgi:hypothetical protein
MSAAPTTLDLNGITSVAEGKRLTNQWLEANGLAHRHHLQALTGCSAGAVLGRNHLIVYDPMATPRSARQ